MQIQINTDNKTKGSTGLSQHVESVIKDALDRFANRITRIEVHLSDESSDSKSGSDNKRCAMEARLAGLQPITVTHQGASLEQAVSGATDKLEKTLESTLGRLDDQRIDTPNVSDMPV
ncbi:MAG: HPF/RaiA family ribosome-associated protein [Candidatus Melainabacteria bacterium]|nr:HPF/RaiA family ribosome-associated protein [Candidatus Melainabacteria bacterium]